VREELIEVGLSNRDRSAVSDGGIELTYGDLYAEVAALIDDFAACGPDEKRPMVAIARRGFKAIIFMLACILDHRPFLFVDPQTSSLDRILHTVEPAMVFGEDLEPLSDLSRRPKTCPPTPCPDGAGYIVATSGTSGPPKLVVGSLSALHRYLRWQNQVLSVTSGDRFSCVGLPWYDFTFKEVLAPLLAGASVRVASETDVSTDRGLAQWLDQARVSIASLHPFRLQRLLNAVAQTHSLGTVWPDLRALMLSGERLPTSTVRRVGMLCAQPPSILALYGPTEATVNKVFNLLRSCEQTNHSVVPLGEPISGTTLSIEPSVSGAASLGELVIHSDDLAIGYIGEPPDSATRFIEGNPRRLHTGDLVRRTSAGELVFVGRKDRQVKRRGTTLSPGVIEDVVLAHTRVDDAACLILGEGPLVVLACCSASAEVTEAEIRSVLVRQLRPAELPDEVLVTADFPLTPLGKLDSRQLSMDVAAMIGIRVGDEL